LRDQEIRIESFLANLPLFMEAAAEEIERIAQGTHQLRVRRGQILFNKGDPCESFHLVVYGQVKLALTSPLGAEKVIEIIGPGGTFGEALMFMEKPYIVYGQALMDSLVLNVHKTAVFEEIERNTRFARKMIAGLCQRLHGLVRDVEAYSLHSGKERLVGYLLRESKADEPGSGELTVTLPASKTTIASRLNLTPEYFSRILHELAHSGLIAIEGRKVRILEIEDLKRLNFD
jgi:CRP/FNR family transcriptional regulator, dissimilatory nitrate respiration regulator